MADIHSTVVWASEAWRLEAVAWIDLSLEAAGITRCGDVEQLRIRPWATVMTVPTCDGQFWFKATAPETAFEVTLYPMLTELAPGAVLTPLAMDTNRSWLLMPDGGSHLDEVARGDALVEALTVILPRNAELQRIMAPAAETLIANGVADMRSALMLGRFDEALRVTGDFASRSGEPEHRAIWKHIADMRDTIAAWCEHLAASPAVPSLDHNDLHPRNILIGDGAPFDRLASSTGATASRRTRSPACWSHCGPLARSCGLATTIPLFCACATPIWKSSMIWALDLS